MERWRRLMDRSPTVDRTARAGDTLRFGAGRASARPRRSLTSPEANPHLRMRKIFHQEERDLGRIRMYVAGIGLAGVAGVAALGVGQLVQSSNSHNPASTPAYLQPVIRTNYHISAIPIRQAHLLPTIRSPKRNIEATPLS